jgi:leucyl aminopeptidase
MQFTTKTGRPESVKTDCLVVPVNVARLAGTVANLDAVLGGRIAKVLAGGDLENKPGRVLMVPALEGVEASRVLLAATGNEKALEATDFCKMVDAVAAALKTAAAANALWSLGEVAVKDRGAYWKTRIALQSLSSQIYRFDRLKSNNEDDGPLKLKRVSFAIPDREERTAINRAIRHGVGIDQGMTLARDLGNLPSNVCTPSHLAREARKIATQYASVTTHVIDERRMKQLGMGSLLSVTAGTKEPARLIVMEHKGGRARQAPYVLVGKGITFDTGGISLKPGAGMDEMKFDMCGAASVLGTISACAKMELALNVVGIVAAAENMPGGEATKPGDIVTSMSGQTIEILNTDAEGRLVLCDALTYAERYKPRAVVDIATLTGACVVALGRHASGVFANDDALARDLVEAGELARDRAWQMPLWEEYGQSLKSNFADVANVGGREGSSIVAASFLSRFARGFKWAHIDIAGTAWLTGTNKGATGRPVPLLVQFLLNRAKVAQ